MGRDAFVAIIGSLRLQGAIKEIPTEYNFVIIYSPSDLVGCYVLLWNTK